jgi:hypothetical protein
MIDHILVRRASLARPQRSAPGPALTAIVPPVVFVVAVMGLTATQYEYLRGYGWRVTNHAAVPWPSVLATGRYGWLLIASFALLGIGLLAAAGPLRAALPRTRAARVAAAAVAAQGLGLCLAAFPIDGPAGDPSTLTSWVHSWHATVHVTGFLLAGVGAVVATAGLAMAGRRAPGWAPPGPILRALLPRTAGVADRVRGPGLVRLPPARPHVDRRRRIAVAGRASVVLSSPRAGSSEACSRSFSRLARMWSSWAEA